MVDTAHTSKHRVVLFLLQQLRVCDSVKIKMIITAIRPQIAHFVLTSKALSSMIYVFHETQKHKALYLSMAGFNYRIIPNVITVARIFLVIPVAYFLFTEQYTLAFYFFFAAGCSDALDGFLARKLNSISEFGAALDPVADKLLMLVSFAGLTFGGKIPWWLLALVIFRDCWIIGGAICYRIFIAKYEFAPSEISKMNTFFQILLITVFLFDAAWPSISILIKELLIYIVVITGLASMIDYTWVWGNRAWILSRQKK